MEKIIIPIFVSHVMNILQHLLSIAMSILSCLIMSDQRPLIVFSLQQGFFFFYVRLNQRLLQKLMQQQINIFLLKIIHMRLMNQHFFIVLLVKSSLALFSPTPYVTLSPPLIEAGCQFFLFLGSIAAYSSITSQLTLPQWKKTYTITLNRLKKTVSPSYRLILGINGFDFTFGQDPTQVVWQHCWISASRGSDFDLAICVGNQVYFRFWKVNYVAVSNQLSGVYIFIEQQNFNSVLTPTTLLNAIKNYPSIAPITGTYIVYPSIFSLKVSYPNSTVFQTEIQVSMTAISSTQYKATLTIYYDIYAMKVGYFVMIVNPGIVNDMGRQNVMLLYSYVINTVPYQYSQALSSIPYNKSSSNYFVLLRGFNTIIPSSKFQFTIISDRLYVQKYANMGALRTHIVLIYANQCESPFEYDEVNKMCLQCLPYCMQCDDFTTCNTCFNTFSLSPTNDTCACPYSVVSNICYDFVNSPMNGCINAFIDSNNTINCVMCSPILNLVMVNNECLCKERYQLNPTTKLCEETCGDGVVVESECDDGNFINNDGCDSSCKIEVGFICNNNRQPSYCTSEFLITFEILSVMKDLDNSFTMQLIVKNQPIPFDLQLNQFTSDSFSITVTTATSPPNFVTLNPMLLDISSNIVTLSLPYEFTLQGLQTNIGINMSPTRYPKSTPLLKTVIKGDNSPIMYSSYLKLIQATQIVFVVCSAFIVFLLLAGVVADKFIGLEAVSALQLIYYSPLLIIKQQWPVGLQMFKSFQYANGYNHIVKFTTYHLKNGIQRNFYHLGIRKLFIQNFNISFALLLVGFLVFVVTMIVRQKKQENLLQFHQDQLHAMEYKRIQRGFKSWLKVNEMASNAIIQLSLWSILQVFSGISAQIKISNSHVQTNPLLYSFFIFPTINTIVILLSFAIIYMTGLNLFSHGLVSNLTMAKMRERMMELNYKRWFFLYFNLMGLLILALSDVVIINTFPMSIVVLVVHVGYMLLLIYVNPYKLSLRIHTVGLFTCQFVVLVFLVFINLINLLQNMDEITILLFSYFIIGCCLLIIILTIVRLYYEYRYGSQLQRQIQRQRQLEEKNQIQLEQKCLKGKMRQLQQQNNKDFTIRQQERLKNPYLHQNQLKNQQKNDLIWWLDNRPTWLKQQRQEYYYKNFDAKPVNWVKENQPEKYQQILVEEQDRKAKEKERNLKKNTNPEYQKLVKKLKKSYAQKQKLQSNQRKSQNQSIYH